jgi:hypothetical protein
MACFVRYHPVTVTGNLYVNENYILLGIDRCSLVEAGRRYRGAHYLHHSSENEDSTESLKRRSSSTRLHGAIPHKAALFLLASEINCNLKHNCVSPFCAVTVVIFLAFNINEFYQFLINYDKIMEVDTRLRSKNLRTKVCSFTSSFN